MTPDIRVTVRVVYASEHSSPGAFVFVYFIRIENHEGESYKLLEREWNITDGNGEVTRVRGEGVIGEQPLLPPGGVYEYNSFVRIAATPGSMAGAYVFQDAWGAKARVPIPAFALTVPETRTLN